MSKLIVIKMEMRGNIIHGETVSSRTCLGLTKDPDHEDGILWCAKHKVKWYEGQAHSCVDGSECTYERHRSYY